MNLKRIFFTWLFLSILNVSYSKEDGKLYTISKYVHDETATLSYAEISALNNKLSQFHDSTGTQIVVLIITTTGELNIEDYALQVAEENKIGRKGVDDGILLLVAKKDKKIRIEVGYGLEAVIPDIIAKRIIKDVITSQFKNGQFYYGIDQGVDALFSLVKTGELPEYIGNENSEKPSFSIIFIFIALLFVMIGAATKSKVLKIIITVVIGLVVFFVLHSIILTVFSWILSAIFVFASKNDGNNGGFGGYGGGGFGGYSGGGGFSSGGGFSGGGGSFGGGGASGGW